MFVRAINAKGSLYFTATQVERGAVVIRADDKGEYVRLSIPIGKCSECKARVRVLPLELLPRKVYGISFIQLAIRTYCTGASGYRETASRLTIFHGTAIAHSTLHRWISGLGNRILDQDQRLKESYPPPVSSIIAQSDKTGCHKKSIMQLFLNTSPTLSPFKYQSKQRHDQLKATTRILLIAIAVFNAGPCSLQKWNETLLPDFNVAVWNFPTGKMNTSMQRAQPP